MKAIGTAELFEQCTETRQEIGICEEGSAEWDELLIVAEDGKRDFAQILLHGTVTGDIFAEQLCQHTNMFLKYSQEDILFMLEMAVQGAFGQAGFSRKFLGCHTCESEGLDELVTSIQYRSEEHTSELQSLRHLVCRLLLEKKKITTKNNYHIELL